MSKSKAIDVLNRAGQSVWYDNLSRDVLQSGELARLIESGVSGLTSNPSIFKAAIADSSNYDQDIIALAKRGLSHEQICEDLMFEDVRRAADLLLSIFKSSAGADGYASVEVSPVLAYRTAETVANARRIWSVIAKPNIMIKVPATAEGIPAIRTLLEEGINVNATLIFSVDIYRLVIEAYLSALEARASRGEDLSGVASVASFFVSRVDEICEKRLAGLRIGLPDRFLGKAAIANTKAAYALYRECFGATRFEKLRAQGARVQRPLWASTGSKNPKLSPLVYVSSLAGPDTVNTMKPETLTALVNTDHLTPSLEQGLDQARTLLVELGQAGVDLESCLKELEQAGVEAFSGAYAKLLDSISAKRRALT